MVETRQAKSIAQDPEELPLQDIPTILRGDNPAWLLDPQGTVMAVNLYCSWVWGVRNLTDLFGFNAFDVYRHAFASGRLPLDENDEALIKKFAVVKHLRALYGDSPYQSFLDYFQDEISQRSIADIQLATKRGWRSTSLYDYPLHFASPLSHERAMSLAFHIKVHRLAHGAGWLSTYEPEDEATRVILTTNHWRILSFCATIDMDYVQYGDSNVRLIVEQWLGTRPMERETPLFTQSIRDQKQPKAASENREPLQWDPPEIQAQILAKPDVTLHIGASTESREAFEVLDAAGVTCSIDRSNRRKTPSVTWGGLTFKGTAGIHRLACMFQDMDASLDASIETDPAFYADYEQPGLDTWMEKTRQRLSEDARAIVYQDRNPRRHVPTTKR